MIDKKCPKCGSKSFQLVDYCKVGYIYSVEDGKVMPDGQDDSSDHISTTCSCNECGHIWHPRNLDFEIDE